MADGVELRKKQSEYEALKQLVSTKKRMREELGDQYGRKKQKFERLRKRLRAVVCVKETLERLVDTCLLLEEKQHETQGNNQCTEDTYTQCEALVEELNGRMSRVGCRVQNLERKVELLNSTSVVASIE